MSSERFQRLEKAATDGTLIELPRHGLTNLKSFIINKLVTQKTENMETLVTDSSSRRNSTAKALNGFMRTSTATGQSICFLLLQKNPQRIYRRFSEEIYCYLEINKE